MNATRLVVLVGSFVMVARFPARSVAAPPDGRTVVMMRVDVSQGSDLSREFAKEILRRELSKYGYSAVGCLDDLADEEQAIEMFDRTHITRGKEAPRQNAFLQHLTSASCKAAEGSTRFAARIVANDDRSARRRSVIVTLRNLTHPEDNLLSGKEDASLDTPYEDVIRCAVGAVFGQKACRGSRCATATNAAFIVGASGVVAGAITGAVLLAMKAHLDGSDCPNRTCGPSEFGNVDLYNSLRIVSTTAFIVGGVGLVTGAGLLRLCRPAGAELQVAIVPQPNGGSATLLGRF